MLWHFYGLQGSGKSVGVVIFAQDFYINKCFPVNFLSARQFNLFGFAV